MTPTEARARANPTAATVGTVIGAVVGSLLWVWLLGKLLGLFVEAPRAIWSAWVILAAVAVWRASDGYMGVSATFGVAGLFWAAWLAGRAQGRIARQVAEESARR